MGKCHGFSAPVKIFPESQNELDEGLEPIIDYRRDRNRIAFR